MSRCPSRQAGVVQPFPLWACTLYAPNGSIAAQLLQVRGVAKSIGYLRRDKHPCKGDSAVTYLPLWPWLVHRFGVSGALLSYVLLLSWIVTPVLLALLYRKSLALERRIVELGERIATQNRQQQVERLKRDGDRRRPGRRR